MFLLIVGVANLFHPLHLDLWINGSNGILNVWRGGEISSDLESPNQKNKLQDRYLYGNNQSLHEIRNHDYTNC